jgi:hypothetical protein
MADEQDKTLSKALADFLKSTEDRKNDPKWKSTLEALASLSGSEAARTSFADLLAMYSEASTMPDLGAGRDAVWQLITSAAENEKKRKAAETNTVDIGLANVWFGEHWPHPRKCSVCSAVNWGVVTSFAHVPLGQIGKGPAGTYQPVQTSPCVVVTCRTCGNTLFFNAIIMGLLPESAE